MIFCIPTGTLQPARDASINCFLKFVIVCERFFFVIQLSSESVRPKSGVT
jgi:hypothetical protein